MINQLFDISAADQSDSIALVYDDRRYTYFELQVYVDWLARYFKSIDVQPGHRIAILMPNCPEYVISILGMLRLGGVVVPLHPSAGKDELKSQLVTSAAHAVITVPECRHIIESLVADSRNGDLPLSSLPIAVFEEDNIATSGGTPLAKDPSFKTFAALPDRSGFDGNGFARTMTLGNKRPFEEHPAFLFCQPGTTVNDRMWFTHRAVVREVDAFVRTMHITSEDCFLCMLPLAEKRCLIHSLMGSIAAGARMVLLQQFSRQVVLKTLIDERITICPGSAETFSAMADQPWDTVPKEMPLRLCLSAEPHLAPDVNDSFIKKFGVGVKQF